MDPYNTVEFSDTIRIAVYTDTDMMEPCTDVPKGSVIYRKNTSQGKELPELPELTKKEIKENIKEILRLTESKSLLALSSEAYSYRNNYTDAASVINCSICQYYESCSYDDQVALLECVYTLRGYVIASGTSTGYCQSSWMDYFIALPNTPDDPVSENYAQGIQDEYAAWAYGDGYGYGFVIQTLINGEWEDTDNSCWGFSGNLTGSAPDYMIEEARHECVYLQKRNAIAQKREKYLAAKQLLIANSVRKFEPVRLFSR